MIRSARKLPWLLVLFVTAAYSIAEETAKKAEKPASEKKLAKLTETDESNAIAFAREHHPELAELLTQLSKSNRAEYERAVRELNQASQRLKRIKAQTPASYDDALEGWKLDSRIRLLAARSSMTEDPALEAELKAALKQRVEVRRRELISERDRLNQRVGRIDEQVKQIETDPEKVVEQDLQRIKASIRKDARKDMKREKQQKRPNRTAKKSKPPVKSAAKPAAPKEAEKAEVKKSKDTEPATKPPAK